MTGITDILNDLTDFEYEIATGRDPYEQSDPFDDSDDEEVQPTRLFPWKVSQ